MLRLFWLQAIEMYLFNLSSKGGIIERIETNDRNLNYCLENTYLVTIVKEQAEGSGFKEHRN